MSQVQTPAPSIEWGELKAGELDCGQSRSSATASGQSLTVLFDDLAVTLNDGAALSRSRCACFQVPVRVERPAGFVGYLTDLRGFVAKTDGTRIVLVTDLGGSVTTHAFPYGPLVVANGVAEPRASAGPGHPSATPSAALTRTAFSLERRDPQGTDADPPAVPPFFATLLLVVQRRGPEDFGSLHVDSLDVSAVFSSAPAGRHERPEPRRIRLPAG
jgi:hypothetical protein